MPTVAPTEGPSMEPVESEVPAPSQAPIPTLEPRLVASWEGSYWGDGVTTDDCDGVRCGIMDDFNDGQSNVLAFDLESAENLDSNLRYLFKISYEYSEISNASSFGAIISNNINGDIQYVNETCPEITSCKMQEVVVEPTESGVQYVYLEYRFGADVYITEVEVYLVDDSYIPSENPVEVPNDVPSPSPSIEPSPIPSEEPSPIPSEEPSPSPSEEPSPSPSEGPASSSPV